MGGLPIAAFALSFGLARSEIVGLWLTGLSWVLTEGVGLTEMTEGVELTEMTEGVDLTEMTEGVELIELVVGFGLTGLPNGVVASPLIRNEVRCARW